MQADQNATLMTVEISILRESKLNPRRSTDPAKMAELVESVRTYGVLQPLVVRRNGTGESLEVIAGHRRLKAALEAGLQELPVVIRNLDDRQAVELMIVENLQREDLHPLEEAECYRQLHEVHGHPIEELAAQVGKSKAYIYNRLQLSRLPDEARKLFQEGRLTAATAQLVTKLSPDQQVEAARTFAGKDPKTGKPARWNREPMTLTEAKDSARDFMTWLSNAPWKLNDAELVPAAGPCSTCPKRTGAQPELWGETRDRTDACLDRECFAAKRDSFRSRVIERAEAKGQTVLEGKAAEKAIAGSHGTGGGEYIDLAERDWRDQKNRTLRTLLREKGVEALGGPIVAVKADGSVLELVPRKAATAALRAKYDWAKKAAASDRASTRSRVSARLKRAAQTATARAVVAEVLAAAELQEATNLWHVIAAGALDEVWAESTKEVCRRRGIEPAKRHRGLPDHEGALRGHLGKMTSTEARILALELLVTGSIVQRNWTDAQALNLACEALAVDRNAILARVKRELAKPAAGKGAKKKSAATGNATSVPPSAKTKAPRPPKKTAAVPVEPQKCVFCGCTDEDCRGCLERTGESCTWRAENLCSACRGRDDALRRLLELTEGADLSWEKFGDRDRTDAEIIGRAKGELLEMRCSSVPEGVDVVGRGNPPRVWFDEIAHPGDRKPDLAGKSFVSAVRWLYGILPPPAPGKKRKEKQAPKQPPPSKKKASRNPEAVA